MEWSTPQIHQLRSPDGSTELADGRGYFLKLSADALNVQKKFIEAHMKYFYNRE
jgi:hypothetical protein